MSSRRPLYLASKSPRRIALLSRLGLSFRVLHLDFRETTPRLPGEEAARLLAWRKAEWALRSVDNGVIVTADTVVSLGNRLFGKPRSRAHAASMLRRLSGRTHTVITAIAVVDARTHWSTLASERSRVTFRRLGPSAIARYVGTGEPSGKAGAYAVQGAGRGLVARVDGDIYNVVGLPVRLFAAVTARFGIRVPAGRIRALYSRSPRTVVAG